jgi:hypothetical protein
MKEQHMPEQEETRAQGTMSISEQRMRHVGWSAAGHEAGAALARNWQLNPTQQAFVTSPLRFSLYIGGIGSGKTFAGAVRAILRALEYPGSLGLIGAPTYAMLRDTTARLFFELLPPSLIAAYHKGEQHLILRNGSEILLRSLDTPDHARGLNLAWFWLDEATLCGHYAWRVLKGRLRQRGYATAAWATGTPQGRDGFWRDFEQAPHSNHALYRANTYANAHNLPDGYVENLGYGSSAFYQQEVMGLFVAFEGLVYAFDAGNNGNLREPPPDAVWTEVIGGIDWGYTNPAAALVIGLDGDGRAWLIDEFYQRRAALTETLLPALLDLTRRYGVQRWFCGPDEPEHIAALAAALAQEGLPAQALRGDNAVRAGIQTITGLLARRADGTRGLYVAPRCVHTITEFGSYQYATVPDGQRDQAGERAASEMPLKQHDHALDALRYALHSTLGRAQSTSAYLAGIARRATPQRNRDSFQQ